MRRVAVLVAALVLSCACAGDAIQHEMLDGVEAIMEKDPSEALQRLSSIDTVSLQSKPLKARYALLKSMALDDAELRVLAETHDELDFVLVRSIETE